MELFINISHVVLSILLILVIILQPSKGSDIGAAFGGGGGSSTMFGPRGAGSVLSRATTVIAVLFLVTSITLAKLSVPEEGLGKKSMGAGSELENDLELLMPTYDDEETTETTPSSTELPTDESSATPDSSPILDTPSVLDSLNGTAPTAEGLIGINPKTGEQGPIKIVEPK